MPGRLARRAQPAPKHFAEDLQVAGPVDERFPWSRDGRQGDGVGVPVGDAVAVELHRRRNAVREIQQLPDGYPRLAGIAPPLGEGIGGRFIQLEEAVLHRGQRGDTPEALRAAVDAMGVAGRFVPRIPLKEGHAPLDDEQRIPAPALGIGGGILEIARLGQNGTGVQTRIQQEENHHAVFHRGKFF